MHRLGNYYAEMPKSAEKGVRELLAANAKAIREARKLSQPDVSKAAKKHHQAIDSGTVSRIERQNIPPSVDTLAALAAGLGVEPWQLLHPDGPRIAAQHKLSLDEHEKVEKILEQIGQLSKPAQAELFGKSEVVREIMQQESPSNTTLEQKGWSAAAKQPSRRRA